MTTIEKALRDLEDIANDMSCMTQYTRHKADQIMSAVNHIREAIAKEENNDRHDS